MRPAAPDLRTHQDIVRRPKRKGRIALHRAATLRPAQAWLKLHRDPAEARATADRTNAGHDKMEP